MKDQRREKGPGVERKAFTEYAFPRPLSFRVIVEQWWEIFGTCDYTDRCKRASIGACPICAIPLCSKHASKETVTCYPYQNSTDSRQVPLCPRCHELPLHIRAEVRAFRKHLQELSRYP